MMILVQTLKDFMISQGVQKKYWLAYSGGLDSHVLLSAAHAVRVDLSVHLQAIHINHGLSPQATLWSRHCARICQTYEIPFIERAIEIKLKKGASLEEAARNKRYAVFSEYLTADDILLTAHQEDDQAETLLLQLLRGSGIKGLAAMPVLKPLGRGWQGRPFLSHSREVLAQYARTRQLQWIEDESNQQLRLTRNFLRLQVLPLLKSRWPTVTKTIARSAHHAKEAQYLLQAWAMELLDEVIGSRQDTLSVAKLKTLSNEKQKLVLRAWISGQGFSVPDTKKLMTIQKNILTCGVDKNPLLHWGEVEIRRYRDDLYVMSALASPPNQDLTWDLQKSLLIPGIGKLRAYRVAQQGLAVPNQEVVIRFRQGGETIYLHKRGRRTLKNLFQEWGIPPWQRDRMPLIYVDDQLVAVADYLIDATFAAKHHECGYMFELLGSRFPPQPRGNIL